MNLTATASSIAASGGIRPDSHITARPVTARKAGPVALTFCCAHRSVRHHERPLPCKASRLRDSSAGFCLAEPMGLRSGGSGIGGVPKLSVRMGDFKSAQYGSSQPRLITLAGQRRYTDERLRTGGIPVGATSRSGSRRLKPCEELQSSRDDYNLGNPCAEKAGACRSRSIFSL